MAALTTPDHIEWVTGSDAEWTRLTDKLVEAGTFVRLDEAKKPNSFYCASDPTDVARVEDRTFICSVDEKDAGPTNNWMDPDEMKDLMRGLYGGCMKGRTMYVIPFVMGHLDAENPMFGVEITDSEYVVVSMRVMARIGVNVLRRIEELGEQAEYVPALHSVGAPLEPGQQDVTWPCNDTKYIVQFPEERMIWSYGSGYGGNALLGKKCYSLRIASVMARDEGWLAEHMLILKLDLARAAGLLHRGRVPERLRQDQPRDARADRPGLEGRDARRRHRLDALRRGRPALRRQPRVRLLRRRPRHQRAHQPQRDAHHRQGQLGLHQRRPDRRRRHLVGGHGERAPAHATSWKGQDWTPDSDELSSHPNSRYCTPIEQCPILRREYDDPKGVPISAIFFGGRRKTTVPLVTESRDWMHGMFMGATLSSETTAAATGPVGVVRRDPMAMLPFIGYNAGDYFQHWINIGKDADAAKLPKIFYVNWFRRDEDGGFLWPGFGENSRVLKWAIERIEGKAAAVETPIGHVPTPESLDTSTAST